MTASEFSRPTFKGGRFDSGTGVPVDVLPDLAVYAEIVTDVAKAIFKDRNPTRQRVSGGFEDRLQLRIVRVEDGSQIAVLERERPANELEIPDEFDDADDLMVKSIAAVANGDPLPPEFPTSVLPKFSRLGQRLRPAERILFTARDGGIAAYDRTVRTRLVQMGGRRYSERNGFTGLITDLNSQTGRFELRLTGGKSLGGEYGDYWSVMHSAQASPPEEGQRVRVDAEGEYAANGEPLRLLAVHEVTLLDSWDWAEARLAEIANLPEGWHDGDGDAVSTSAIEGMRRLMAEMSNRPVAPPHLFPTPEGGVQAEWRSSDRTVSIEFEPDGQLALLHSLSLSTGEDEYEEVDSSAPDTMTGFVERLMPSPS